MKQYQRKIYLNNIISHIKQTQAKPVLIIGDIMLDHYVYGVVNRISPEAPVPIVEITFEEFKLGGAANVANNLSALGEEPLLIGVIGHDEDGSKLKKILNEKSIPHRLVELKDFPTTKKTRIIAQNQQVIRLDRENYSVNHWPHLKNVLLKSKNKFEIVVISDYGKGVVEKELLYEISNWKCMVLIDPKKRNFSNYQSSYLITPNRAEAEELSKIPISNQNDIIQAGKKILKKIKTQNLLITLGSDGMVLFEKRGERIIHLPAMARKVYDVTGAGDTVLSAVAFGLSKGLSLLDSCIFANICAGIVVGKLGTSVPLWEEIEPINGKWEEYLNIELWEIKK